MSSRLVDGVELPLPVGGHPALDFCNTRAGWNADRPKEYLLDYATLALWCREFDLLSPATVTELVILAEHRPEAAQAVLDQGLAFREALYRVSLGSRDPAHWARLAGAAEAARAGARLVAITPDQLNSDQLRWGQHGAAARWQPEWSGLEAVLLSVAHAAADLLTGRLADRVSACPGAGCGWLFGDPRSRRRWCSMAVCGNRAKARRHRSAAVTAPSD